MGNSSTNNIKYVNIQLHDSTIYVIANGHTYMLRAPNWSYTLKYMEYALEMHHNIYLDVSPKQYRCGLSNIFNFNRWAGADDPYIFMAERRDNVSTSVCRVDKMISSLSAGEDCYIHFLGFHIKVDHAYINIVILNTRWVYDKKSSRIISNIVIEKNSHNVGQILKLLRATETDLLIAHKKAIHELHSHVKNTANYDHVKNTFSPAQPQICQSLENDICCNNIPDNIYVPKMCIIYV